MYHFLRNFYNIAINYLEKIVVLFSREIIEIVLLFSTKFSKLNIWHSLISNEILIFFDSKSNKFQEKYFFISLEKFKWEKYVNCSYKFGLSFAYMWICTSASKVEKILKGSMDSILSPSVKIQTMGGKVCLRCKGKTMLGIVNKFLKTKSLLTSTSKNLNFHWRWRWWVQI